MPKNKYKIPQKQWRKWSPGARELFNALFSDLRQQVDFNHPKAEIIPARHWKTIRWNAAWYAASLHDEVSGRGFTSTAHPGGR
jgi:hypothetical protein